MMRLFVALGLPDELRTRLAFMARGLPGARWVPPENYHLTLRFIGEVAAPEAEEIDHALAALHAPAFSLVLSGIGTFSRNGRPATLYVGVDRNPALDHLQSKIETALQRAGLAPERRRFSPHVSLARLDNAPEDKLVAYIQTHNLFRSAPVPVERFTLYSSRLGKEQAHYEPEAEYALG
jgi:2'-5' RNA ligase